MEDILGTSRCADPDCSDRIDTHTLDDDEEDYIEITYKQADESGTGETIYYHSDCAPLGGTNIPDKLGVE